MNCQNCGNRSKLFKKSDAFSLVGKSERGTVYECNQCGAKLVANVMSGTRMITGESGATGISEPGRQRGPSPRHRMTPLGNEQDIEFTVQRMEAVATLCAVEVRMGIRQEPLNADHLVLLSDCVNAADEALRAMGKVLPSLVVDSATAQLPLALCDKEKAGPAIEAATWTFLASAIALWRYSDREALTEVAELVFPVCWEFRSSPMENLIEFRKETWEVNGPDSFAMNALTSILRSAGCLSNDRFPGEQGLSVWSKLLAKEIAKMSPEVSRDTPEEFDGANETVDDIDRYSTPSPKGGEELQAFANALPRMIQNGEAPLDVEALKTNLPRFSDDALFHVERAIRMVPDVKKQTIPMLELVRERRDRASIAGGSFQGVELDVSYETAFPAAYSSSGFNGRGIESNLLSIRQDLEAWSAADPDDMKYLAVLRACVAAAADLLEFLGSIIPEMERLPFEGCFRSLPTALLDRVAAEAALHVTTWLYLVQATTLWWPTKEQPILAAASKYMPPPFDASVLGDLVALEGMEVEDFTDPLAMGSRGKLQLTLTLRSMGCLGSLEAPGPGDVVFWDDAFFSYVDALDEGLDLYERFLGDLGRKS